jgi:hypothetical protein
VMEIFKVAKSMIILEWILRTLMWEGVDWIRPDQNRNEWQTFVSTVMNIWVP